jgi:hypothetical protein
MEPYSSSFTVVVKGTFPREKFVKLAWGKGGGALFLNFVMQNVF